MKELRKEFEERFVQSDDVWGSEIAAKYNWEEIFNWFESKLKEEREKALEDCIKICENKIKRMKQIYKTDSNDYLNSIQDYIEISFEIERFKSQNLTTQKQ